MTLTLKLIVFFLVLIGDGVAAVVVSRSLRQQGKGDAAKVVFLGLFMSLVVVAVVLFVIL